MEKPIQLAGRDRSEDASNTISSIGERALIERLKHYCAEGAVGDDAALMQPRPSHRIVVSTDMLTENVHFSETTTPPYSVGWRAAAANLSDLAAMGATPIGITVALGLAGDTPLGWVDELYRGMADCLARYGGAIYGGDLCQSAQRSVSITAVGQVCLDEVIYRGSASPGMAVAVSGSHGGSRAGLAVLLGELAVSLDEPADLDGIRDDSGDCAAEWVNRWIQAHQRPVPRFDVVRAVRRAVRDGQQAQSDGESTSLPAWNIAGMDSSDGLADALLQLSEKSQIGMDIYRPAIPLAVGLSQTVGPETALDWALYGGEDFELVLCLPSKIAEALEQADCAIVIGKTTQHRGVRLLSGEGGTVEAHLRHNSFQHF